MGLHVTKLHKIIHPNPLKKIELDLSNGGKVYLDEQDQGIALSITRKNIPNQREVFPNGDSFVFIEDTEDITKYIELVFEELDDDLERFHELDAFIQKMNSPRNRYF